MKASDSEGLESERARLGLDSEPIPLHRVFNYASPLLALTFFSVLSHTYYVKFGADALLVAPGVVSTVFGLSRLWEALCDPTVGFLSDRTQSFLGRRRSWIAGAVVPLCFFPFLMWSPPSFLEGWGLLACISIGSFGFATALSSFQIPHSALAAEMSPRSDDRSRCYAANGLMNGLGAFIALTIGLGLLSSSQAPRHTAMLLFSAAAILLSLSSIWMIRNSSEPAHHQGRGASLPLRAYRDVWSNPHARILIFTGVFIQLTYAAMGTVAVFMLEYVYKIPDHIELFMVCYFVPSLLSVPLWVRLTRYFEKRHLWIAGLGGSAVVYGILAIVPEGASLAVALPLGAAMGIMAGGFPFLDPAIRAEVIDYDEYVTGERKEGVYFAASQILGKAAAAFMTIFVGVALQTAGYVPNMPQNDSVKLVIRFLFGGVPMLAFLAALLLLLRFKLSEKMHARIRLELDRRHADAG
jgi:GPH family glycoside/pentoside/hexuronide:cation symporter